MEYPPREVPGNVPVPNVPPGRTIAPAAGPDLPETMPPGNIFWYAAGHAGIVHFDLDPTNGTLHSRAGWQLHVEVQKH